MRALNKRLRYGRKQQKDSSDRCDRTYQQSERRMNGLSYSKFMYGLKLAGVEVNRKMLSEMAIADPAEFMTLAGISKEQIGLMKD